jgi:hypothetical protein
MASSKRLRNFAPAPARSAVTAAAITEPQRKPAARKDTRQFCKGKPGREHQPVIVFAAIVIRSVPDRCEWRPSWMDDYAGLKWACWHREDCSACGRILRDHGSLLISECPDWPGDERQKAEAEAKRAVIAARIAGRPARRGRVVAGPQHYRRKKAS